MGLRDRSSGHLVLPIRTCGTNGLSLFPFRPLVGEFCSLTGFCHQVLPYRKPAAMGPMDHELPSTLGHSNAFL